MKRLLFALILCFAFSSGAQAGKPSAIEVLTSPDVIQIGAAPGPNNTMRCHYQSDGAYELHVQASKGKELTLEVLAGNEVLKTLRTTTFTRTYEFYPSSSANFFVDAGISWSLVWTFSSTKGKGRVIDAVEVWQDTCKP